MKRMNTRNMSDVDRSVLQGFENHLALLPQEIGEDPKYDIRLYASDSTKAKEEKKIAFLAQSLERDGQLDDCLVVPAPEVAGNGHHPKYIMVAGHRRRAAAILVNDKRGAAGQPLLRLRCRVLDPGDAVVRKCAASNLQREDLSPMHKALLFERTRKQEGWGEGPKADKKVAEFFGVSLALVTTHNQFLTADHKIKEALASGEISADTALELIRSVRPENVGKVLEGSRVEQIRAAADRAADEVARGKKTPDEAKEDIRKAASGRIEAPAARKAIRSQPDEDKEGTGPVPLTRKEIIEEFASLDGPAYGPENGVVRQWARYVVEKWVKGEGSTKGMLKLFDKMVDGKVEAADKAAGKVAESKGASKGTSKGTDASKSKPATKASKGGKAKPPKK